MQFFKITLPPIKYTKISAFNYIQKLCSGVTVVLLFSLLSNPAFAAKAPSFTLPSDKGKVSLKRYRNKVVYLDFWASWCEPCRQSFPWMNDMHHRYSKRGLKIISINLDENKSDAKRFLKQIPAAFTVAYDPKGRIAEKYKIKVMPSSFIINRSGKIVRIHEGFHFSDKDKMEAMIKRILRIK